MSKILFLGMLFCSSFFFSQDAVNNDDFVLDYHFPKEGYGDYIYSTYDKSVDYKVIPGPKIENQLIKMIMEVKGDHAKLFMHIKNVGNPSTSLSFSKAKFKLHDKEVRFTIKESGNSEKLDYRWFKIDDQLIEMLIHAQRNGCEITYEFEKNGHKAIIDKENIQSIYQMFEILNDLLGD